MILLVNVFLHDGGATAYNRGHMPSPDMLDIYKYTLASYAAIPYWSKVIINTRLSERYRGREESLHKYISELFVDKDQEINFRRNEYQHQWKDLTRYFKDECKQTLVWYMCNHDHPFMDYNLDALQNILCRLYKDPEPASCYLSHFPEIARSIQRRGPIEVLPEGIIKGQFNHMDSIQLVHKDLLHSWWHDREYGPPTKYLPRSDWDDVWHAPPFRCYIPQREIVKHFDGYSHLFDIHQVPPHFIPTGFFENNIKIRYGYWERKEGWVHINPMDKVYQTQHWNGVDLRCLIEDVPMFWWPRVSETDIAPGIDPDEMLKARNEAYRTYLTCYTGHHEYVGNEPPEEWVQASMR